MNSDFIPALRYHFLTPIYDNFIRFILPEKRLKNDLIRLAKISEAEAKLLDFGCGTGTLLLLIENKFRKIDSVGIDIDDKMLSVAKRKLQHTNSQLLNYNGSNLPFLDDSFDVVLSSWVFHHFTRNQKFEAFSEIKRILKPGKSFYIADWGKPSNVLMRVLFFFLQLVDNFKTTKDNVDGKLPELLEKTGFENVKEIGYENTILGTLCFYSATKPNF